MELFVSKGLPKSKLFNFNCVTTTHYSCFVVVAIVMVLVICVVVVIVTVDIVVAVVIIVGPRKQP